VTKRVVNLASGTAQWTRTHTLSHAPDPSLTMRFGAGGSPNAFNECHAAARRPGRRNVEAWRGEG
jgi:hypothetical protein